ncbi:MAG: hypothetical protein HQK58_13935 [Deltaproteobacteria bacterium]|nr:hypothetical protein [Deltaproteobacteria bacterium]
MITRHRLSWFRPVNFLTAVVIATLVGLVTAGCGMKARPAFSRIVAPTAVTDLRANPVQGEVILRWTPPGGTGEPGAKEAKGAVPVSKYRLYRRQILVEDKDCSTCPARFNLSRELYPGPAGPLKLDSGQWSYVDRDVTPGYKYLYLIYAVSQTDESSGPSNAAMAEIRGPN